MASLGATVRFDEHDHADVSFRVNLDTGDIRVGARALEALWLHCHTAWLLFRRLSRTGYGSAIELADDPEFQHPVALLRHSLGRAPTFKLTPGDYAKLDPTACAETNEVFLCATAWCLLHEIGHLACRHGDIAGLLPTERKRQEKEADDWASGWALDRWQQHSTDDHAFAKRAGGAALALLHLVSHEVYDRQRGGDTHPDPPDRLDHFIRKHLPFEAEQETVRPRDVPLHFAVCTLKLYFDHKEIALPQGAWESATDCLGDMLLALKRHDTAS